jgi:hypothetical protein
MHIALPSRIVDLRGICLNGFASGFSRFFDFSRDKRFFLLLVESALKGLSLDAVCCLKDLCPDRLLFYLNRVGVDEMLDYTNTVLQECFVAWKKNGGRVSRRGYLVAIDVTDFEYYGEKDEYIHDFVKPAGRAYKHIRVRKYAALSIIAPNFKLCLALLPVKKGEKLPDLVDRLLSSVRGVKIRCIIMDKEFYNRGVLDRIEAHGLHYLVPIVKKDSHNLFYWISTVTDHWKWKYFMGVAVKQPKQVTGYFHEYQICDYAGFITNRDMKTDTAEKLLELYHHRWNIENGFKEAKEYLIKTTSKNHAYRLLLYAISHLLANLQNIIRDTRFRVRYYEMQEIIRLILDPMTEKKEYTISKRLIVKL